MNDIFDAVPQTHLPYLWFGSTHFKADHVDIFKHIFWLLLRRRLIKDKSCYYDEDIAQPVSSI